MTIRWQHLVVAAFGAVCWVGLWYGVGALLYYLGRYL